MASIESATTSDQTRSENEDAQLDTERLITLAVLEKKRNQKKKQPWKEGYVPTKTDVPEPGNIHDKPFYYQSESDRGGKSQTA